MIHFGYLTGHLAGSHPPPMQTSTSTHSKRGWNKTFLKSILILHQIFWLLVT